MAVLFSAGREHYAEIARLVNAAYRGGDSAAVDSKPGWTHEQGLVDGPRTSAEDVERELSDPDPTVIFCLRANESDPITACVLLRKHGDHCYLGMLSVAPEAQNRGLGRKLLEYSEDYAWKWGATRVTMTVLHVRDTLIAWYERRGYRLTGERVPFPYDNKALGKPRRDDLAFVILDKYPEDSHA